MTKNWHFRQARPGFTMVFDENDRNRHFLTCFRPINARFRTRFQVRSGLPYIQGTPEKRTRNPEIGSKMVHFGCQNGVKLTKI